MKIIKFEKCFRRNLFKKLNINNFIDFAQGNVGKWLVQANAPTARCQTSVKKSRRNTLSEK